MGRRRTNTTWERVKGIFWIVVALASIAALIWVLGIMCGCAVGTTVDGDDPMVGFRLSDGAGVAKTFFGTVGGVMFGPPGAAIGTALAGFLFGNHRGSRKGWDEHGEYLAGVGHGAVRPAAPADPVPAPAPPA